MVEVIETPMPGVLLVEAKRFGDPRGYFWEPYNKRALAAAGIKVEFVQDNHSCSALAGTVRGLHFQIPPHAQDKLIWVARGRIFDVVVDLRQSSPTFRQHYTVELSADEPLQIFVPAGFAHGFCTLEPGTEVMYKVSDYYAPVHERGIRWNDPELGIPWPVAAAEATLSAKDERYAGIGALADLFP